MGRSPWVVLGVAPGADPGEIRRAYARRLRKIRPDEDAQGFQRLVEARDLALQLASGERVDARLAHVIAFEPFEDAGVEPSHAQQRPDVRPRAARAPSASLDTGPLVEISAEPHDVLEALRRALATDDLTGWQSVVSVTSKLTHRQRAAVESDLIQSLSVFAAQESRNRASWPPNKWPFFALVAALDEEFGWRESNRLLYGVLDEQAAHDFIGLLQWSRNLSSVARGARADLRSKGPALIALSDIRHFYDGGRDQRGLDAYWLMVNDPTLWRDHDAATDLFFPAWSLQEGRYRSALLGLLGWAGLILAFAPWRSVSDALPFVPSLPKEIPGAVVALLVMGMALWCLIGSAPPHSPTRRTNIVGPLWDSLAFFGFPLWALARRLYVRAAIGLMAWSAIASHLYAFRHDLGVVAAVTLVGLLHIAAGEYGQRWVVYKLQRTVAAADRHRIFDPHQRADFLRRHGTRSLALWTGHSRPVTRQSTASRFSGRHPWWWKWLMALAAITAILRVVEVLWFRG